MATTDYFFFTDANQQASNPAGYIKVQTSADAYGPVVPATAGTDEYRVTSLHSATFDPTAYAACDAIVCVQRVTGDSAHVNIILKPLVQPALNFAPVKYIIYKGVLASSLINGTEVASPSNNDLTKSIWKTQTIKNVVAGTSANPSSDALGVGSTAAANADFDNAKPIDNLFYRTGVAFELSVVKGGWSIGQFDKNKFGMEVLMEGLNFRHTLKLARQIESNISVPTLATNASDAQIFDHWHDKEQILGFMDPCAFYGSFFLAGIRAKTSGNVPFAAKTGNSLYQELLFPFANRNSAYLDIRNEHNFSFNYFKNYGDGIMLSGNSAPVNYYASKWPIMALNASSFPANTTSARNTFSIQLPVGDNPRPLVYVSQGYRDINAKADEFPPALTNAERFYDAFETPAGGYTATKNGSGLTSMTFAVPNVTGSGYSATTPVSCYIRLKYLKQQLGPTTGPTVIQSANYLDNLVYPIDLGLLSRGPSSIKSSVYDEEIYVNAQNVPGLQFDAICKVGIARDAINTSFFMMPTVVRTNQGRMTSLITVAGETSDSNETFANLIASKYAQTRIRKSDLVLAAASLVPVAEFVSDADPSALGKFDAPDFSKFLIFVVSNATCDAWKNKISTGATDLDNRFRVYLGVTNLQAQTDTTGVPYLSFELVLRGFARDTATDSYRLADTNTDPNSAANITVYASAPAPVTCEITSGADGMSTSCVPVDGVIQLTAVPSSGSGTYAWNTTSNKIALALTANQTVRVMAKKQVSASRGAERVQLVFTPTGGTPLPPVTRDISVISVEFCDAGTQNYGYDDMDGDPGINHHVSVERLGFTTVRIDILGGGTADDLEFTSDDTTIAVPVAPAAGSGASFELTIEGKNQDKAETSIKAVCIGGPICATIQVNVYKEKALTATVTRVYDSTVNSTALSRSTFDPIAAAALINTKYKSVVAKLSLTDGGAIDVHYDLDGDGALLREAGTILLEIDAIKTAVPAGDQRVIIVKRLLYIFYLSTPSAPSATTLTFKPYAEQFLAHIKTGTGQTYSIGAGAQVDQVQFTSRIGNVFTLDTNGPQLNFPHSTSEGIIMSVNALSGEPIIMEEQSTEVAQYWLIAHEVAHSLLHLADLDAKPNLMHFDDSRTDHNLRFKQQPRHFTSGMESQWEKIIR